MLAAVLTNQLEYADELYQKGKEIHGGFFDKLTKSPRFVSAYYKIGNFQKIKEIWEYLIREQPNNAQLYVSLAATYLQLGERQNAIKELEKAIELEPKFKEQGEYFINEIRAGRNP